MLMCRSILQVEGGCLWFALVLRLRIILETDCLHVHRLLSVPTMDRSPFSDLKEALGLMWCLQVVNLVRSKWDANGAANAIDKFCNRKSVVRHCMV